MKKPDIKQRRRAIRLARRARRKATPSRTEPGNTTRQRRRSRPDTPLVWSDPLVTQAALALALARRR